MRLRTTRWAGAALGALTLGLAAPVGAAALFTVNSNGDAPDANAGNGVCDTGFLVSGQTECTLRAAIAEANAFAGIDFIYANALGADPDGFLRITPQTPLPAITDSVWIDFDSIPGYDHGDPWATPLVQIDGSQAGFDADGLVFQAASILEAVAIHGFDDDGVEASAGLSINGCHFGVKEGQLAAGNGGAGIDATAMSGGVIGQQFQPSSGWTQKGNVISNNYWGILIGGDANLITGNRIGTDLLGQSAMRNDYGVFVLGGTGNEIGAIRTLTAGGDVGGGNLLSGNRLYGVFVGSAALQTSIQANYIGTDVSGALDLGNGSSGLYVLGSETVIGQDGDIRNVISGNDVHGIVVGSTGTPAADVSIVDNTIGLDASRTSGLGNFADGIRAPGAPNLLVQNNTIGANGGDGIDTSNGHGSILGNVIGTDENRADRGNGGHGIHVTSSVGVEIGDIFSSEGNEIAFNTGNGITLDDCQWCDVRNNDIGSQSIGEAAGNGGHGVYVDSSSDMDVISNRVGENGGSGVVVTGSGSARNRINNQSWENVGRGIDLGDDDRTLNDIDDHDSGANRLQNFAEPSGSGTLLDAGTNEITVRYRVRSKPTFSSYPLLIEIYRADADGEEGLYWIGADSYQAIDYGTHVSVTFPNWLGLAPEDLLVLTATDAQGNTSEFSNPVELPEPGALSGFAAGVLLLVGLARSRRTNGVRTGTE